MVIHSSFLNLKDGIWLWMELVLAAVVCFIVFLRTGLLAKLEDRIPTMEEADTDEEHTNLLPWPTTAIDVEPVYIEQAAWHNKGVARLNVIVTR